MIFSHWPILLSLLAYSDVTVSPARSDRSNTSFHLSLSRLDRPGERTIETLRRHDLESRYRHDVHNTLMTLEKVARANPDADVVFALAELSWIEAKRLEHRRKGEALDRYVDTVAYAYDFLFSPEFDGVRQPSDPRFREACNLYNGGLDRLLRASQANNGRIEPDGVLSIKVYGREQKIRVSLDPARTPWKPEDIDQIILCSDFEVSGLPTKTYQWGVGVPLIAVRKSDRSGPGPEKFYPTEMAFPLTAFLQPTSKLRESSPTDPRDCTLQLVDPVRVRLAPVSPPVALESDLTTPLAYMWSKSDLSKYRWTGLLRPEQAAERAGLMMIRPYEPKKIPVVMVHGLASTPLAWIPMLNELLRDPRIQENYQFMLYMYPTGVPFPIAAAGLRETLMNAQATFDPEGAKDPRLADPNFSRMVLVGHSMGGLLSHAMAVSSDDKFWRLNSDRQFGDINGPPNVIEELRRYMIFEPLPFVSKVVFVATPHRGSDYSRKFIGRLGANLISDPDYISKLLAQLVKDNPNAFNSRKFRRLPTSIETLETNGKMLLALLEMRPNPAVDFFSIIGSLRPEPTENTTDGVVPFASSHFPGAKAEVVVRTPDHGVQASPEAIREVQRILLLHIGLLPPGVAAGSGRQVPQ
jgi:pimeloyl-ACP methyl ester carboxylesterase